MVFFSIDVVQILYIYIYAYCPVCACAHVCVGVGGYTEIYGTNPSEFTHKQQSDVE